MKKIAAILFFAILLFNWVGYRLVFVFFENEHNHQMQAKVEQADYKESDLILVKTAYPLPYLVNSHDFERWDGEVDINGMHYKYVKRRFINDSVEFLCLPDYNSTKIRTAKDDYFRMANDVTQNSRSNKSDQQVPVFKHLLNQYCEEMPDFDFVMEENNLLHHSYYIASEYGSYADTAEQPPDIG